MSSKLTKEYGWNIEDRHFDRMRVKSRTAHWMDPFVVTPMEVCVQCRNVE
jgi:hypothetical protein